jgi:hypothetical protein
MPAVIAKPRQYDEDEWSERRPIFQRLYIEQDLPLEDVLLELRSIHDFHVTKHMCKRRLSLWGLVKNAKSKHKAEVLQSSQGEDVHAAAVRSGIRPDKLLRFQKQIHRQALLTASTRECCGHTSQAFPVRHCADAPLTLPQAPSMWLQSSDRAIRPGNSLKLPDEDLYAWTSLHAVTDLMSLQEGTNKELSSSAYVKIGNLIQSGMSLWDLNASAAARLSFSSAAEAIYSELQRGVALDIRFVYYLCPEIWSAGCTQHFYKLRQFLCSIVEPCLGSHHPMSLVVRNFVEIESGHTRLKVWDCLLEVFVKPEEHGTTWWDLAKARWQYCRRLGLYQRAVDSCQHARDVMRSLGKSTIRMEVDILMELTRLSFELAQYDVAKTLLQALVGLGRNQELYCWRVLPLALLYPANFHEISLDLGEAQSCLEQRLKVVLQNDVRGPTGEGPTDEKYIQVRHQLEAISEGSWDTDLGDKGFDTTCETRESPMQKRDSAVQKLKLELVGLETLTD